MDITSPATPPTSRLTQKATPWLLAFAFLNALTLALVTFSLATDVNFLDGLYRLVGLTLHFTLFSFLLAAVIGLLGLMYAPLKKPVAIVLFAMAFLIVITNLRVYALYHFHLNGMVVNLLLGGALLENIAFSWSIWLGIAAVLASAIGLQFLWLWLITQKGWLKGPQKRHWLGAFILLEVGFILFNGFADGLQWNPVIQQNRYIPWLPPISMRKQLKSWGFDVDTSKKATLSVKSAPLNYPLEPFDCSAVSPSSRAQKPLNILYLIVDSLRADMLTPEIMPFTDSLKTEAYTFNNHYSTSNSTRYGIFSLYYGIDGSYWRPMLNIARGSPLFELTQQHNYQHFIYGSATLTFPEFDRTVFANLSTNANAKLQKGQQKTSAENDIDITQRLIKDIQQTPDTQPFFGFAFYDAPHAFSLPANYPPVFTPRWDKVNYLKLDNKTDATGFLNLYKTTAHFVDTQIKTVVEQLKNQGLMDSTLIVITSDHGQEFNESGKNFWGHNSNFSDWQTKVPMLILWPKAASAMAGLPPAPQSFNHISSHLDLFPTVASHIFGCKNAIASYSTGQSLFDTSNTERSLIMENWSDRAILHHGKLYTIDTMGRQKVFNQKMDVQEGQSLPAKVMQDSLEKMSRYLKH
ncbi:MAG: sulfatase-like hydrolase/transferase [Marinagarivorans sp.]|nr:sulfatase-like hydrolase/transferase [Marinagarivorans sp.]